MKVKHGAAASTSRPDRNPTAAGGTPARRRKSAQQAAAGSAGPRASKSAPDVFKKLRDLAFDSGLYRAGMDNISRSGSTVGSSLATAVEAHTLFDTRLARAQDFLAARGLEGRVVAKLVTADMITVLRMPVIEHAEWQFFLIPRVELDQIEAKKNGVVFSGRAPDDLPGLLDENKLDAWVKQELGHQGLLRSHDNPLFLGRMNLGEGGAGMYDGVPEYAEIGGQRLHTRELEALALVEPSEVRRAIDHVYGKLPGEWGDHGVCHQGAVATAHGLGLDPATDAAANISGLWLTRIKYGRGGR